MAVPAILYVAVTAQALPVAATFGVWGRRPPAAYLRVVVWCMVLMASDGLDAVATATLGNNLWTSWITQPVDVALTLWILAAWQTNAFVRIVYTVAIPVVGTVVAALLLLTNPATTFDNFIGPALALVALIGVLYTLVYRTLTSRGLLTDQDWFWISLGLALFWLGFGPIPPFAQAMLDSHVEWVRAAYIGRAIVIVAAFVVIAWGIVCQRVLAALPGRS